MFFIILLILLCTVTHLFTEVLVLTPLEVLRSIHIPAIVLWGGLILLLAWIMGD
ncbi:MULTISPECIES: hypothetical protein [unclassified Thermosynechococcus]|uniref:hypothetical protein n=1 Tax=unclassified Thermosynechococcus TaxID=2622553 RepID=UPI00167FEAD4|nr:MULTISPECIES: hypothetical protein [unclassified Thermosynechococcus]MDR5637995.1 hypothetical protein [Thermosynechococcus sp. PP42]MDR7898851.1 hypothetical protein [Thermosynechococcus sp. JY1332]MDR7906256.1 hypothetical protein [Thermosynechococcus sp. JY1334]MDR7921196.1 hypothetical protein [Thermosynechococcus sp. HY213]MDR7994076.1 hypothetical protein [Thermosynechococcus sp. TG252]